MVDKVFSSSGYIVAQLYNRFILSFQNLAATEYQTKFNIISGRNHKIRVHLIRMNFEVIYENLNADRKL